MRKTKTLKAKEIFNCRYCGGELKTSLNLGMFCPSGFIDKPQEVDLEPLTLATCKKCGLVQLKDSYDLDLLYKQYWYASSLNKSMVSALKDVVDSALKIKPLEEVKVVVDIGANDNTLLSMFPFGSAVTIAFEPSKNIAKVGKSKSTFFVNDYFSKERYPISTKADLVFSIAMFYDLPDVRKFVQDIKNILDEKGIWVIQLTDLYSMLKINDITNICLEHLEYYTLSVLTKIMTENDLSIFDVEYNKVNGGSLRAYVCHKGYKQVNDNVINSVYEEIDYMESFYDPLDDLVLRVENSKDKIRNLLNTLRKLDKKVYGLGASTKGATLLQYFNITNRDLVSIGEVNKDKFGLITSGTEIPIISEEELLKLNPEFIFLIIWQFRENILEKLKPYIDKGMNVIIPLPEAQLITKKGEFYL
jgi:hypothetical protein